MASYYQLKSGWQYRISYKDKHGEYKTKSKNGFRTKREAQNAAELLERRMRSGSGIDPDISFSEYMNDWYLTYRKDLHSKSNNIDIELSIKVVTDYFGYTKLKDVTRSQYQTFLNDYGKTRATASVRKVHIYAKACLQDALQEKRIDVDPTYNVVPKGKKPPKKNADKYLNYEETRLLLSEIYKGINPDWHTRYMIIISLATGLRFSEVLALNWEDIDFKQKTVRINKSFDYRITNEFKETKTISSNRAVPINDTTLETLKYFKQFNSKEYGNNLFIKTTAFGYDHVTNEAVNKTLKRACKRAEIPVITFHSLRHTYCSLLIYLGLNIKYISKLLGHKSVSTTYNVYGHLIEELEHQETAKMNEFLNDLNKKDD